MSHSQLLVPSCRCLASQNRPAKFRPSWLTGDSCNSVPIFMGIMTLCLESQASMYITVYTMLYVWPTWTLESQPVTFSSALKKSGDYPSTVKRGDGRGDFDGLIKLIFPIGAYQRCAHNSSNCRSHTFLKHGKFTNLTQSQRLDWYLYVYTDPSKSPRQPRWVLCVFEK